MVEKLIDALDMAEIRINKRDHRARIVHDVRYYNMQRGANLKLVHQMDEDHPVTARVDWGRWIADCECGGAEYVTAEDPIFYCLSCGNHLSGGKFRPVKFPSKKKMGQIEKELMLREVDDSRGYNDLAKALHARPVHRAHGPGGRDLVLSRSWDPGETIEDLKAQRELLNKAVGRGSK